MGTASVKIAKERIRSLLIADRMQCTPDIAENLSADIYHAVSKYMEVRPESMRIHSTRSEIHISYIKNTGENH